MDRIVVRLTDDDLFAVALAGPDIKHIITAVRAGEISYVSAEHSRYGRVLLGVRPNKAGGDLSSGMVFPYPLALHLDLPDSEPCDILLDTSRSAELVRHLDEGLRLIGPQPLGE